MCAVQLSTYACQTSKLSGMYMATGDKNEDVGLIKGLGCKTVEL